jgi:hypothetical protein
MAAGSQREPVRPFRLHLLEPGSDAHRVLAGLGLSLVQEEVAPGDLLEGLRALGQGFGLGQPRPGARALLRRHGRDKLFEVRLPAQSSSLVRGELGFKNIPDEASFSTDLRNSRGKIAPRIVSGLCPRP